MAKKVNNPQAPVNAKPVQGNVATKIDALYSWLSYDLQALKKDVFNELKYSAMQSSSLFKALQEHAEMTTEENKTAIAAMVQELKYGYKQNQAIFDCLQSVLSDEVIARIKVADAKLDVEDEKLDKIVGMLAAIEELERTLAAIKEKVDSVDTTAIAETVRDGVLAVIPQNEELDYDKLAEKTEASVSEHSRQVLDAIAAIPESENVDYSRIVEEVGDRMIEILQDVHNSVAAQAPAAPVAADIDYDRIVYGAAEKVIESLPYTEKLDYRRMDENFMKAAQTIKTEIDTDEIAQKVLASMDMEALATSIAAKVQPAPAPEIDYERLSDMIAAKTQPAEVDYERLSDLVVSKMAATVTPVEPEPIDYETLAELVAEKLSADDDCDVVIDAEGVKEIAAGVADSLNTDKLAAQVAEKIGTLPETVDYEKISAIIDEKLAGFEEESSYEIVIDEEHIVSIAEKVAEILRDQLNVVVCEPCDDEPVVDDTPVVDEPVVEDTPVVDEPKNDEPTVEPVVTELAATTNDSSLIYDEEHDQLVDAETGMTIRLKRSFVAKMKQSSDEVKGYYSRLKNALVSYNKLNSNISWHGDRFNYGRDTVAKMNICGKTLCLYLALDPENPDFKTTVYHQKNVGSQKAYESTPFMVKIKSEAAVKKAIRLIEALAGTLGAEAKASYEETDFVAEFGFETTKELLDKGLIKASKEKKVPFDF